MDLWLTSTRIGRCGVPGQSRELHRILPRQEAPLHSARGTIPRRGALVALGIDCAVRMCKLRRVRFSFLYRWVRRAAAGLWYHWTLHSVPS
eukprot:scaffold1173_cov405-Prasinococcus_capsulatus_cf.AAC.9